MKIYVALFCLISAVTLQIGVLQNLDAAELEKEVAGNLERLKKTKECRACNLAGVNLNRAELSGADLEGANLEGAKFYLCNLSGTNLRNSNLRNVGFGGADLSGADLRGADLTGTSLAGAYTHGAVLDDEAAAEDDDEFNEELDAILDKGRASFSSEATGGSRENDSDNDQEDRNSSRIGVWKAPSDTSGVVNSEDAETTVVEAIRKAPSPKHVQPIDEAILE